MANRSRKDVVSVARTVGLSCGPALVGHDAQKRILIAIPWSPKGSIARWAMAGVSDSDRSIVRRRYLHPGPDDLLPVSRVEAES